LKDINNRIMLLEIPQSITMMRLAVEALKCRGRKERGWRQETSRTGFSMVRGIPVEGPASITTWPFISPWSRSFFTRARVSIPHSPGTLLDRSHSSRERTELKWEYPVWWLDTISAEAWIRSDSKFLRSL